MNRRAGVLESAGASPAVFGAPPKTFGATSRLTTQNYARVLREAPALA